MESNALTHKYQCYPHVETIQLICYMRATLAFNGLKQECNFQSKVDSWKKGGEPVGSLQPIIVITVSGNYFSCI